MTWTKLSDDHFDREEIFRLSRGAALLHIEALVWCNRLVNDGRVPAAMLARFTTSQDPAADAAELVAAGVWEPLEDGWQVDWTHQRTSEDVEADREANKAKQQAYRDRVKRHGAGDHSACHPKHCPALTSRNPVTDPVTNPVRNRYLTCPDPDPSRPVPKGQGQGQGESADAATASPRRQHDPAGQDEPAEVEPWIPGGDCEHKPRGLDRSRILGTLLCRTCDKDEKARAKARELREAS